MCLLPASRPQDPELRPLSPAPASEVGHVDGSAAVGNRPFGERGDHRNGLDTRIETGGRSMSAGEAQLLAFTRVFLKDPALVILDEASSRLDPATERKIERAMDTLLQGRSAIVIAHRLHTVQRADDILILDNGRVAEYGKRADEARGARRGQGVGRSR